MPSFILIRPTVWPQYTNVTDRQDRQRTDSIGRTVLQTVAQKLFQQLTRRYASENARVRVASVCCAVVGCADLSSPDVWFQRYTSDHATAGCRDSTVSWTMRCYGQTWTGPSHNCSTSTGNTRVVIMAALYNRGAIIFLPCSFFLLSFFLFFPRLISAVGDWMFTILWHMVWP